MVAISQAWYNGSYTMASKPIKSMIFHYSMMQFLIIKKKKLRLIHNASTEQRRLEMAGRMDQSELLLKFIGYFPD